MSDANEGTNGGAESPSSSSAASSSSEQSSSTTPSLSRESRQSETQAINVRAIKLSDQIGAAVESVVGPVDEAKQVSVRDSSGGKYVSVTVGPVTVNSGDEVVQVYAAMRETAGNMLKFYL